MSSKWTKAHISTCLLIWNILQNIHSPEHPLPDNETPENLRRRETTVEQLLNAAKKVAENDAFWATLPETIPPSKDEENAVHSLDSRHLTDAEQNKLAEFTVRVLKSVPREEMRTRLRNMLAKCQ